MAPTPPNVKVDMEIVIAAEGKFEAHPEAYSPRVFVAIMPPTGNEDGNGVPETAVDKVYEILTNGWAVPWPCLPDKRTCGFDYWEVYSDSLPNMIRHNLADTRFGYDSDMVKPYTPESVSQVGWHSDPGDVYEAPTDRDVCPKCGGRLGSCPQGQYCTAPGCRYAY
jgi:hypothetical protein